VASAERGMILVTGVTGSGKSSTMAAIINHINQNQHTPHTQNKTRVKQNIDQMKTH
jgi:Tfp pilus assembly pilus retraction ATPase PilT